MEKNKIVLVNFALTAGGAERYYSELANYLSKEGYHITIILLRKDEIFYKLDNRINIVEPEIGYKTSKIAKCLYFLHIIFFLRKKINKIHPSLIINAAFPFFFMASIFGIKIPVVITIRCDPQKVSLIEGIKIPHLFRKLLYKRSYAIIAQTSYAARILTSQFKTTNIITIPNFLCQITIPEIKRENIIISAGRLKKSKGFDYLLKAFREVNPHEWKLLILGEGPEKQSLQDLIKLFELEDKVTILSYKQNIHEYFARSRIFAFASLSEGFPNVLLEALATPLACISFDINSGPREMILDGKNGFLVESKNISEYASKLRLLINDDLLREKLMDEAIKVRETFNLEKIGRQYIDIIETLKK
jgi:GalNAc-alpha-(1->4)-GalNAc-alpha-(1->3)-diNAcBac-PP-undecaprenol alpha-1,4-N-acetyl-D-galactosaminyltransferase